MAQDQTYYINLLHGFINRTASPGEMRSLLEFIETDPEQYESLVNSPDMLELLEEQSIEWREDFPNELSRQMKDRLFAAIEQKEGPGKVGRLNRWWWAAAAFLLLGMIGAGYFLFNKKESVEIAGAPQEKRFKNDVPPGGFKARLTLADGSTIVLDSAKVGELARQGKTVIRNRDGQLEYVDLARSDGPLQYNTLATSNGQTYATVLADGSKVWLNAASSIRFPVSFTGNERRVEITGEAYFEVAKNPTKPFTVHIDNGAGSDVTVLGTHFNINAYDDEPIVKTSLLEGSIKFSSGNDMKILTPGQQVTVTASGQLEMAGDVDMEAVMAWKNGIFVYDNMDIAAVMRQVSRWYDVEVVYEKPLNKKLSLLNVPRTVSMANLLKLMEMTGNVRFVIDGKKVTVLN